MRRFSTRELCLLLLAWVSLAGWHPLLAQKHSMGSAPPTVPLPLQPHAATSNSTAAGATNHAAPGSTSTVGTASHPATAPAASHSTAPAGPIAAVSTGLGAIQFSLASTGVPAPQTLARQLSADDERIRLAALSALGAPAQYLSHGHAAVPHSLQLDMLQLGNSDDLDAMLTIELDQHVVSAILVPEDGNWRRVATLAFASSFNAGATTPSNFVRPLRSWLQPGRYRAVYHATVDGPNGDFTENEADVRVLNGRAAVVLSFVSSARQCDTAAQAHLPHPGCEVLQRWIEPDPTDPSHRFVLVTGTGHTPPRDPDDPLSQSRTYRLARLRSFSCQSMTFSDASQHFEPVTNSTPCSGHEPPPHQEHTEHPEHP